MSYFNGGDIKQHHLLIQGFKRKEFAIRMSPAETIQRIAGAQQTTTHQPTPMLQVDF